MDLYYNVVRLQYPKLQAFIFNSWYDSFVKDEEISIKLNHTQMS